MDRARQQQQRIVFLLRTLMDAADLQQWSQAWACFDEAIELDYGEPQVVSPDSIVRSWMELLPGFDTTKHHLTSVEVTVDQQTASSSSHFEATHQIRGAPGGDTWVLHGVYEHEYRLTPYGWKITRMRMTPSGSEGNDNLVALARGRMVERLGG